MPRAAPALTPAIAPTIALAIALATVLTACATPTVERQQAFERGAARAGEAPVPFAHLLYLPPGYHAPLESARRWPLIVYLHGVAESGTDLRLVARYGPPAQVEAGSDLPFVIASPQNGGFLARWDPERLIALVDAIARDHRIDEDRVYLTGMSMGGNGTWRTAIAYPERFAALVPVSAFGDPTGVERIAGVPVWAFHGGKDLIVPPAAGKALVDAHRAAGGAARWTLDPEAGHRVPERVYARPDLYDWLAEQRRPGRPE